MGDPEFHGIEDQLFDAIVDSPLSSRDQEREHLLGGPEWVPWGNHPRQTCWTGGSRRSQGPQPGRRLSRADRLSWHVGRGSLAQ